MPLPRPGHAADRALALLLRLLLAGCLCVPLLGGLYILRISRDIERVGWSQACLGDTCVWWSDGDLSLTYPPASPCWQVYRRPC